MRSSRILYIMLVLWSCFAGWHCVRAQESVADAVRKATFALQELDFEQARSSLRAAPDAGPEQAAVLEQNLNLVARAERAFTHLQLQLDKPEGISIATLEPGQIGRYGRLSEKGFELIAPGPRGQEISVPQTWFDFPREKLVRLARVTYSQPNAEAWVELIAFAVTQRQPELAAEYLSFALRLKPELETQLPQELGAGFKGLIQLAHGVSVRRQLEDLEALVKRGRVADARSRFQGLLDHLGEAAALVAQHELKIRGDKLREMLGMDTRAGQVLREDASSSDSGDLVAGATGQGRTSTAGIPARIMTACAYCSGAGTLREMGCLKCQRVGYVLEKNDLVVCANCSGRGAVVSKCLTCAGKRSVGGPGQERECGACKGKGEPLCPHCKGSGEMQVVNPEARGGKTVTCPGCKGRLWNELNKCRRCSGNGKIIFRAPTVGGTKIWENIPCPQCKGEPLTYLPCQPCKGIGATGKVEQPVPCAACMGTGNPHQPCGTCAALGWIKE